MNATVHIFTGSRTIGEHKYIVHLPATSFEEAQLLGMQIGVTINGQLVQSCCAKCGATDVADEVVRDIWPEEFE